MQPLKLSPLPCAIPAEESSSVIRGDCGFVDEAVVRALMAGPVFSPRVESGRVEFTAKGTALDFAGWSLPTPAEPALLPESPRRASQPVLAEPGLDEPHRGPHRWWLAGMAGATCSLLFAVLLLHLSAHVSRQSEQFLTIRPSDAAPAATGNDDAVRKPAPQLTRLQERALPPPMTGD